jgi:hypothetical protein
MRAAVVTDPWSPPRAAAYGLMPALVNAAEPRSVSE